MANQPNLREIRHSNKFVYILMDRLFYEPFASRYEHSTKYVDLLSRLSDQSPCSWKIAREGYWLHAAPCDSPSSPDSSPEPRPLPLQGWKVHVSATARNDLAVLEKAAKVAFAQEVAFKCSLDRGVLSLMSSKMWGRGSSGKFMTLYPEGLPRFERLLEGLYAALEGEVGPYVLSDKRYKDSRVIYYRYGGMRPNTRLDVTGLKQPVLVTPGGETVPDERPPYFSPPSWVEDPLPDPEESGSDGELDGGRYTVKSALSFSNSGGVYVADDRDTGAEVVLKEARAHTLVDTRGNDAAKLIEREHAILEILSDTGVAARPLGFFRAWENTFLAEEFVEGISLRKVMLERSLLVRARFTVEESREYYEIYRSIFQSFAKNLHVVHERGVVYGDMSNNNLRVDPSDWSVRFIDFDGSHRVGVDDPTLLFTPGFKQEESVESRAEGPEEDLYSLAAVMLYLIFPISAVASLRDDVYDGVLKKMLADMGWSQTRIFDIIHGLAKKEMTCERLCELLDEPVEIQPPAFEDDFDLGSCAEISSDLGRFVLAHMRPEDEESLFPADPFMYRTNKLGWGFGACGVLRSLAACGSAVPASACEWLEERLEDTKLASLPPGLLTGASGIAWCLWDLGLEDRARELMEAASGSDLRQRHHSYYYGMAGLGMANLFFHLRTEDDRYLERARDLAATLSRTARENERGLHWDDDERGISLGFGYGQAGVALFFLRLYELTGDEELLETGRRALEFDLSYGVEREHSGVAFPGSPTSATVESYLEEGGAGIAKVAIRYGMWDRVEDIWPSVQRKYSVFAGLLFGLGSFVDVLTDAYVFSGDGEFLEMAKRPLTGIRDLYLLEQPTGLATPGDGLLRVTCDYATGTAGLMRTFHRAGHLDDADFFLDELALVAPRRVAASTTAASAPRAAVLGGAA